MKYLIIYLLIINAVGLVLMLTDKQKAIKKQWRIPESTFMSVSLFGGSLGCLIGMHVFRHKTRHIKFYLGLPIILAVQIVLLFLIATL